MAASAGARAVTLERSRQNFDDLLSDAVALMARAADRGQEALFSEARVLFRTALGAADARILVRLAGTWREWDRLDDENGLEPEIVALAESASVTPVRSGGLIAAQVSGSGVAVVLEAAAEGEGPSTRLDTLCRIFSLAIGSCESRHGNPDKLAAIKVFQRVANRILKSDDLDEIFTQITHEAKARLSADICGIMLKKDEWLVMQRCVGNLASETAMLRMRSGQGVGGRVFETRETCVIEDYVHSEVISRDFFDLARAERVKSALAVPLLSQNVVTGVLEVWRRRPSQFTPQHTAELVTLANLASIAIENVCLTQARESAGRRLAKAHEELQSRYDVIRRSADLQESLTDLLLSGGSTSDIAELASQRLARPVIILDRRLEVEACFPADLEFDGLLSEAKSEILKKASDSRAIIHETSKAPFYCQRIVAGTELLGWALTPGAHSPTGEVQLALGEICGTVALHRMKERAASRAISDKLSSLLWDMIDASEDVRRIAYARAQDLGVDLSGGMTIMVCWFDELRRGAGRERENGERGSWRQTLAELPTRLPSMNRAVQLCTLLGDELVIVAVAKPGILPRDLAGALCNDLDRAVPGTIARIGVSRRIESPDAIPSACKDARIALAVTRQAGRKRVLSVEDIGVAGLLISMQSGADFKNFVAEKMRCLIDEKSPQREALLETLRVYFASNCSQQATANKLRLHQKTVAYRLDKIEGMTGLDLSTHEARAMLDLAVRMNDLLG